MQLVSRHYLANSDRRIIPLSEDSLLAQTVHGFNLVVPTWNIDVGPGIIRDGVIEPWTNDTFLSLLKTGGRVVNVGANFGYYSVLAAQTIGRTGRVYAIEANPVVFAFLSRSVYWGGYPDVIQAYNCAAVGPDMHNKPMDFLFDPQFIGGGSIFNCGQPCLPWKECFWGGETMHLALDEQRKLVPRGIYSKIQTLGLTLDSIVKEPIDTMLIDAEGSECFVIAGAKETIARSPDLRMIMEWGPINYTGERIAPMDEMWDFLLDDQKFIPHRVCHENYGGLGSPPKLTLLNRKQLFEIPHSDVLLSRQPIDASYLT